jgi:hypothetical protein
MPAKPLFFLAFVAVLSASPITIVVPNGAKVQITATYNNNGTVSTSSGVDNGLLDEDPAPGRFKFTPPNQSQVGKVEIKSLGVPGLGVAAIGNFNFGPLGLDNWTPIYLPLIGSVATSAIYVTDINVAAFSGTPPPATGSPVTITNGAVSGLPGVTVRDASGVYSFNSFFDVFVTLDLPNLPLVTGTGQALDPVGVGMPEPSGIVLIAIGLSGLLIRRLY